MKSHLINYIVSNSSSIKDTLKIINKNKARFALVVANGRLVGVVTDGDLRRLLLSGLDLNNNVEYHSNYYYLDINDGFDLLCEKFRKQGVDFLPILNKGKLVNLITKKQFHAMLLEGVQYAPDINFFQFDSISLEHEIYNRPWGFYKSTWLNSHAQAKIITIFPKSEISLQSHFKREEHWVIVKGNGVAFVDNEKIKATPGSYVYIPLESKHKIINSSESESLIMSEVQLGTYFGEDDIIRFKDKYGRS